MHTSTRLSSVNLTDKLTQLGETLRYARNSFTSMTSALTAKTAMSISPISTITPPAPERVKGKLDLVIVEARNLAITNALHTDIYCLAQYDCSTMSTLEQPKATTVPEKTMDIFEKQLWASSPKWQYSQSL